VRVVQLEQAFQRQSSSDAVRHSHYELFRRHAVAFRLRTNRLHVEPHAGNLSLKTVFAGAERYEFPDRVTTVTPGQILFVKPDVTYSSSIRTAGKTDSFSLFLPAPLIRSLVTSRQVDTFLGSSLGSTSLPGLPKVAKGLERVAKAIELGDELGSDAALVELVAASGAAIEDVGEAAERLTVTNMRTRAELMRRVLLCRELLHDHVEPGISLARLAEETCLSEFHLMRCFRQCFGISVAQYLVRLRMLRAAELLATGRYQVTDVARRCGYADLSAFGRAFRRYWGRSATNHRLQGEQ
jgi:AraC-like DNA-binding protein